MLTYETIKKYLCREFNFNEAMQVLRSNFWIRYATWGVSTVKYIDASKTDKGYVKGILLNVSGHLHKGYVLLTLGWDDTYTVTLINMRGKVISEHTQIYFDELVDFIDNKIERIPKYKI